METERIIRPGEGERRAIGGYLPQYVVSSSIIMNKLRNKDLQWIKVADPEAGRVDDLQVSNQSRIDAYQVKWSRLGGTFTFNNIISPSGSKTSLINQLADGWKRLRENNPKKRVVVHLVTNQIPSVSDRLPKNESPRHFKAFIEQVWNEVKRESAQQNYNITTEWENVWNTFKEASGLAEEDFNLFINDCELEFNYQLPEMNSSTPDQKIMEQDLADLTYFLIQTVADPGYIIELKHDQLLEKLGWKARFEFRSLHEFPVNEKLYYPIEGTVQRLDNLISSLYGGYIAVLGAPGSGKSTLLTQTFRSRHERVIRYYAYIPETLDPIQFRGESVNFLHDMVIAIENAGFIVGRSPSKFNRAQLLEQFYEQLDLLHQDWLKTGRKTIIVIDGLDHITREQNPKYSLFNDLPTNDQISEGIYFILGSQTESPLPDRIQSAIKREGRTVTMERLSRKAVFSIIDKAELSVELTSDQITEIYRLSDGHPLAFSYLLMRISAENDLKEINSILQSSEEYRGNIEDQYYSYWKQIEDDYELTKLIGLIARLRSSINISWIETWNNPSTIHSLRQKFRQYFRIEENQLYFFHNSFRLFLLSKTAESFSGDYDPNKNQKLHYELAKICSDSDQFNEKWEELYHLFLAEKHELVLRKASQEYFHEQFLSLRSPIGIQSDIKLALKSVEMCHDPVALTRLLLAGSEINQRDSNFDKVSLISLLIDLGEIQSAMEYIKEGNRLRIEQEEALKLSIKLYENNLIFESRSVFELAEPFYILMPTTPIENREDRELLETWALSAPYFLKINEIIDIINQIKSKPRVHRNSDEAKSTDLFRNRLLFNVGLSLLDQQRWDDALELGVTFDINNPNFVSGWFWLHVYGWKYLLKAHNLNKAKIFFEKLVENIENIELNDSMKLDLAEGYYRIYKDKDNASKYIENIPQPELDMGAFSLEPDINEFLERFYLNRMLYVLGDQRSPSELIPDSNNPREQGIVNFERKICIISRIWADAWCDTEFSISNSKNEIISLLRFHNIPPGEARDRWMAWNVIDSVRGGFYQLLIDSIKLHGQESIKKLGQLFENEWKNPETSRYWSSDVRRQIIMSLYNAGLQNSWIIKNLKSLEEDMDTISEVPELIKEYQSHAKALILLDEMEDSFKFLRNALEKSLGIGYYSDYQLNTVIKWLSIVNSIETEKAAERIEFILKVIIAIENSTGGDASKSAADELISAVFKWSPRKSVLLFQLLIEQGLILYENGIYTILVEAINSKERPLNLILLSLTNLLIPFSRHAKPKSIKILLKHMANNWNDDKFINETQYLISKVKNYSSSPERPIWLEEIFKTVQELEKGQKAYLDIKNVDLPLDKNKNYSETLKLINHKNLDIIEVKKSVNSLSDIKKLLNEESDESYFNWKPIIKYLIEKLDINEIIYLASRFENKDNSAQILAILSERLYDLGDSQTAWSMGIKALDSSKAREWLSEWSGSRLFAFKALIKVNKGKAKKLMYKTLIDDITTEFWYPKDIMMELDSILSLFDDLSVMEIWLEIEKYLKYLMNNLHLTNDISLNLKDNLEEDNTTRAIADLIVLHLNYPIRIITQMSQNICIKRLLKYDKAIQKSIRAYLDEESYQENILMILDAISLKDANTLDVFKDKIIDLQVSHDYSVRRMAWILCRRIRAPIKINNSIQLPELYFTPFPVRDIIQGLGNREIPRGQPLPDSNDPIEIVSPYNIQIEAVAIESGFEAIVLCHRIVQIMNQFNNSSWLAKNEVQLRATLEHNGLRLTLIRPRSALVRKALFYMISELIDAERLSWSNIMRLEPFFQFYDPNMMLKEPIKRPKSVNVAYNRSYSYRGTEEWLNKIHESINKNIFKIEDNRFILGEKTKLRFADRNEPTELRKSKVYVSDTFLAHEKSFFFKVHCCSLAEYLDIETNIDPLPLIIYNESYEFESWGINWIALNPRIGKELGWHISKDGLFRWLDDEDNIMVESIWWKDGIIEEFFPSFSEVGEGWIVVASKSAIESIKSKYGILMRSIIIKRCLFGAKYEENEVKSNNRLYYTSLLV